MTTTLPGYDIAHIGERDALDVLDAINSYASRCAENVKIPVTGFGGRKYETKIEWKLCGRKRLAVHLNRHSPTSEGMLPYHDDEFTVRDTFGRSMLVTYSLDKFEDGVAYYSIWSD